MKATIDQRGSLRLVDAGDGCDDGNRFCHLIVKGYRFHLLGLDVDLPAGDLAGEAGILAALSNGEGELILGHGDDGAFVFLVDLKSF